MDQILKRVSFLVITLFTLISHSETRTSIDVDGLSFISPDFDEPQKNTFGFIGATLKTSHKKFQLFSADIQGRYAIRNSALSFLNIKEVYFSFEVEDEIKESTIHLGRKLKVWSSLDESWNLGFYQPQFRWNTLNPENQGLTGLFWDRQEKSWGLSLFGSSFFIPDQGASYEVKDGKFEDSNPWFRAPPQNIKFQGQILPIDYNLDKPEIADVVLRPLFAAQLRLGESHGFFADLAAAYKPSHQFAIGYSGVLVTSRVRIDVKPEVYMENIYSADLGYRNTWGLAQFSFLYTAPQNPTFESSQNTPEFEPSLSFGPRFQYKLNPFEIELAYLDTEGGTVTESGPDTSVDRPSLSQRFLFREALQVQISFAKVFMKSFKWNSQFQYRHSEKDKFEQIHFKNKINLKGPWAFWSDIILIETGDATNLNMNAYRNLDQFWIGVSYDI